METMEKKLRLAFVYNIRHNYPDPKNEQTQLEADFDDPETIATMIKHMKECGYQVLPIEANEQAYLKLYKNRDKIDLVFNFAEGMYGKDREAQIPAMLEMLRLPYVGSSPLTQALVLDKAMTKEVLIANDIPTLPFQLFKTGNELLNPNLTFPLIVKPDSEGSGAGITNKSIVHTEKELRRQVLHILKVFHGSVLVEPFLTGPEYSIAMVGNPPQILPFISPNHKMLPKQYAPLDSLAVKWVFEEQSTHENYLMCPAHVSKSLDKKLRDICINLWNALNIRDWCRVDIRCDGKNRPYVLEINSPVGLLPPEISTTSYMPLAARAAGIDYNSLLSLIVSTALKRYSHKK
jgi:D-alanine-D-alanine ligase